MATGTEASPIAGTSASPNAATKVPHVIKVTGVSGAWLYNFVNAPMPIAANSGIGTLLQEIGLPLLYYTQAAVDSLIAFHT